MRTADSKIKTFLLVKDIYLETKKTLNLRGNIHSLTVPAVMGIINATPDSFYAPSRFSIETEILATAEKMVTDGVAIFDVGGYSTRPGATDISEAEELSRVVKVIDLLHSHFPKIPISIDTFRSNVAKVAVAHGAAMVNDISGGGIDENMIDTVGQLQVPYVLTHTRGTPQNMQEATNYQDLIKEMLDYFEEKLNQLRKVGVKDVLLDLGFGFAKKLDHNFELLKHLEVFHMFKLPILIGLSRKSMIYKSLQCTASEALNGTTVVHTAAILKGASMLRVHDVKEAVEVISLCEKIKNSI